MRIRYSQAPKESVDLVAQTDSLTWDNSKEATSYGQFNSEYNSVLSSQIFPSAPLSSSHSHGKITGNGVRLRESPSLEGKIIGAMNKGDNVKILQKPQITDTWLLLSFNIIIGYAHKDYVELISDVALPRRGELMPSSPEQPIFEIDNFMFSNLSVFFRGKKYVVIDESQEKCLQIEEIQDFDGDGILDALVADIEACGGNITGNGCRSDYTDKTVIAK